MGVLLRNVGFMKLSGDYLEVAADLRKFALVIILIRAGLGLDPVALKRLSGMVMRLAIIPSIVEVSATAVMAYFFLDLPWIWGFLLGAVMAAVSPAVVVPCLFSLQDRGYGRSKGIPTLVIAAASFDDIISISLFGVILTIIYSSDSLTMTILKGPIGLVGGMVFGICWGTLLWYIPERHDRFVVILRSILLGGGGVLVLFGTEAIGYDGAGPLGCVVAAFVASHGWRKQGYTDDNNPVGACFSVFWTIFQPILFGLIGTEIDLYFLDLRTVGLGAGCLAVSLASRIIISVFVASGGNLTWKEKIFVAWAWFPKATVQIINLDLHYIFLSTNMILMIMLLNLILQAAIGPVALDIARQIRSEEAETYATKVLIVAVLAILVTAPTGAILISILGPRLLQRESIFSMGSHILSNLRGNHEKTDLLDSSIEC
ncbi:Sodium/hydrogen exchanger 9B2 [Blattella germanica]|nr:Sodium/hydrogen exchanger 9B2 [Blattella germanica]